MRLRTRNSNAKPTPYVVPPTTKFEGNDGSWSTFYVGVGIPEAQNFRVLVSMTSPVTWIIASQGCTTSDPSDCSDLRGIENYGAAKSSGYNPLDSTNSTQIGDFQMMLDNGPPSSIYGPQYNYINASFYLDIVGLGPSPSSSLELHEVVGAITSKDIFLGEFGLGINDARFQSGGYQTFLEASLNCSMPIPSLSYGYTAGASYRKHRFHLPSKPPY